MRSKLSLLILFLITLALPSHAQNHSTSKSTDELIEYYINTLSDGQFKAMVPHQLIRSEYLLLEYLEKAPPEFSVSPWIGSMVPSLILRDYFYQKEMNGIFDRANKPFIRNSRGQTQLSSEEERRDFLSGKDPTWSLIEAPKILKPAESEVMAHSRNTHLSSSQFIRFLACFRSSPMKASTCVKILNEVEALMSPVDFITAIPIVNEVLYQNDYTEGTRLAALKIMDKVVQVREGKTITGDLFSDIFDSFVASGIPHAQAEEMTWNVLAVYSSRGPNMYRLYPYLPNINAARTILSLQSIAMAVSVLDAARYDSGHLYSLPPSIQFHAPYGKPYHFWMSAFLSRRMSKIFKDQEAARKTISMVEFAYQLFSETKGRENLLDEVAMGGVDHASTHKVRLDLAVGYAGAAYGVLDQNQRSAKLNLDQVIEKSLQRAHPLPTLKSDASFLKPQKVLLRWFQYLKPYSLMKETQFKMNCNELLKGND